MVFNRGDSVEVMSNDEGLEGSYFEAIVITKLRGDEYIVTYRTLLEEDLSGPLREVVPADNLRPSPPEVAVTAFRLNQLVDVNHNDGWWKGQIIGRIETLYNVFFENGEELPYQLNRLRVHQDWVDGRWITPPSTASTRYDDGFDEA